jgi:ribosomal protein S18 acetylase RimI-like enzyme
MTMMQIRQAIEQDYPAIIMLMKNELGYPNLVEEEAKERLECFRISDDWETFVAVINNEVVGFIGVMKNIAYNIEGYYSQIVALAVSEKTRRMGIGTELVRKAEEWSLSHGITDVAVNSNMRRLDAHALYENLGYMKKSYSFKKSLGGAS